MLKGMVSSISAGLSSGGTVEGDITITEDLVVKGDLKVEGGGSFSYDEIIEGTMQVQNNAIFAGTVNITEGTANQSTYVRIDQGTSQYTAKLHFGGLLASNADYLIGEIAGIWDINQSTAPVSAIRFETGADTTNKDDGRITFWTSSASRSLVERMRIEPDGTVKISANEVIDKTDTEAFLVRKASDGGDVFVVDTTNNKWWNK